MIVELQLFIKNTMKIKECCTAFFKMKKKEKREEVPAGIAKN